MMGTALARKLGISSQRLCDFEKGRRLVGPPFHAIGWLRLMKSDTRFQFWFLGSLPPTCLVGRGQEPD